MQLPKVASSQARRRTGEEEEEEEAVLGFLRNITTALLPFSCRAHTRVVMSKMMVSRRRVGGDMRQPGSDANMMGGVMFALTHRTNDFGSYPISKNLVVTSIEAAGSASVGSQFKLLIAPFLETFAAKRRIFQLLSSSYPSQSLSPLPRLLLLGLAAFSVAA